MKAMYVKWWKIILIASMMHLLWMRLRLMLSDNECSPAYSGTQEAEQLMDSLAHNLNPASENTGKSEATYVIGISVSQQHGDESIRKTLSSLIEGLSAEEQAEVIIIVVIDGQAKFVKTLHDDLVMTFEDPIKSGLLEIKLMQNIINGIQLTGDIKHKSRDILQEIIMMTFAHTRGKYYLKLSDNVLASRNFIGNISKFIFEVNTNLWINLKFSSVGLIGNLYKTHDLSSIIKNLVSTPTVLVASLEGLLQHYTDKRHPRCLSETPLGSHCLQELGFSSISHYPALFNPIETLNGKLIKTEHNFPIANENWPWMNVPVYINPPAVIKTSMRAYKDHTLEATYINAGYFHAFHPQQGDFIEFIFKTPVIFEEYFLRCEHYKYPRDIFKQDTYVDVQLPLHLNQVNKKTNSINKMLPLKDNYFQIGQFNSRGIAEGSLGSRIGKIKAVRIRVITKHDVMVVLREIVFKIQLVPDSARPCCEPYWPS
ncbi:unnamed protein product [Owenia fusiformis]|uniref:Uncharacterized protein n=1 Tax=Owenia fusiformis TaxID=6347 RepID=A0A8J1UA09_OWEFU|nr:unnamed protein product [Owenia fusiformis]